MRDKFGPSRLVLPAEEAVLADGTIGISPISLSSGTSANSGVRQARIAMKALQDICTLCSARHNARSRQTI
jgi:hypothetical protein